MPRATVSFIAPGESPNPSSEYREASTPLFSPEDHQFTHTEAIPVNPTSDLAADDESLIDALASKDGGDLTTENV